MKKKYIAPAVTWTWLGLDEAFAANGGVVIPHSNYEGEDEAAVKGEKTFSSSSTSGTTTITTVSNVWDEEW